MSARMELHVALSLRLDAIVAHRLANAYRAEVLREAADKLTAIADETETRVAEHYGTASGIGPGSAEMVREAARTVRSMADATGKDTASSGESTQPAEQPYTEARAAFMQIGTTSSLDGLRTELRIDGHPPLVGRYCGAGMRRAAHQEGVLIIEPLLAFEYTEPVDGGDA